jgi:hypothetical protein
METCATENNTAVGDNDAASSDAISTPVQLQWFKMICSLSHFGFNSRFLKVELKEEIARYLDSCGTDVDENIRAYFL